MASHHQEPLRQQLIRSCAEEGMTARAVRFDPDARAFEAFSFSERGTGLLDPVAATTLDGALAEVTERSHLDRGDRIGVREIGEGIDLLHIYAVRRTTTVTATRPRMDNPYASTALAYKRRLEHICTVDQRAIAGIEPGPFNENPSLDDYRRREWRSRQRQRPEGARLER